MPLSGYPTSPLVGGTSARAAIFESYVFQSGIQDIEHSKILSYKYPQYYMTALLDKLGAAEPVARSVFSWSIMDRTRTAGNYTVITSGGTGASAVVRMYRFSDIPLFYSSNINNKLHCTIAVHFGYFRYLSV